MIIENTARDYLAGKSLDYIGDNVFLEVPVHPPQEYVLVEKTASGEENRIDSAMIAVQSISRNKDNGLYRAQLVNEAVKAAMKIFAEESTLIYSCRLNTDYNFTDPDTGEHRYQAVFNIYY